MLRLPGSFIRAEGFYQQQYPVGQMPQPQYPFGNSPRIFPQATHFGNMPLAFLVQQQQMQIMAQHQMFLAQQVPLNPPGILTPAPEQVEFELKLSTGSLEPERIDRSVLAAVEAGRNPRHFESTDAAGFLQELLQQVSPNTSTRKAQNEFDSAVKKAIVKIVQSSAQCNVFGSSVTLLNLATSDTDMVVFEARSRSAKALVSLVARNLKTELRHLPTLAVVPICGARVPIVKVSSGYHQCDISFNNPNGLRSTRMISRYVEKYPVMIPLTRLLKVWRSRRKLPDATVHGLSSYAWSILLIAFLQMFFAKSHAHDWTLLSLLRDFVRTFSNLVPDKTVRVSLRQPNTCELVVGTASKGSHYRWIEIQNPDHMALRPNLASSLNAASASVIAAELDRARTLLDSACLTQSRAELQLLFQPITEAELTRRTTAVPAKGPAEAADSERVGDENEDQEEDNKGGAIPVQATKRQRICAVAAAGGVGGDVIGAAQEVGRRDVAEDDMLVDEEGQWVMTAAAVQPPPAPQRALPAAPSPDASSSSAPLAAAGSVPAPSLLGGGVGVSSKAKQPRPVIAQAAPRIQVGHDYRVQIRKMGPSRLLPPEPAQPFPAVLLGTEAAVRITGIFRPVVGVGRTTVWPSIQACTRNNTDVTFVARLFVPEAPQGDATTFALTSKLFWLMPAGVHDAMTFTECQEDCNRYVGPVRDIFIPSPSLRITLLEPAGAPSAPPTALTQPPLRESHPSPTTATVSAAGDPSDQSRATCAPNSKRALVSHVDSHRATGAAAGSAEAAPDQQAQHAHLEGKYLATQPAYSDAAKEPQQTTLRDWSPSPHVERAQSRPSQHSHGSGDVQDPSRHSAPPQHPQEAHNSHDALAHGSRDYAPRDPASPQRVEPDQRCAEGSSTQAADAAHKGSSIGFIASSRELRKEMSHSRKSQGHKDDFFSGLDFIPL